MQLRASNTTWQTKIGDLAGSVATHVVDLKVATAIRKTAQVDLDASEKELMEIIDTGAPVQRRRSRDEQYSADDAMTKSETRGPCVRNLLAQPHTLSNNENVRRNHEFHSKLKGLAQTHVANLPHGGKNAVLTPGIGSANFGSSLLWPRSTTAMSCVFRVRVAWTLKPSVRIQHQMEVTAERMS